jgi:predicted GIY-YIG superfamily endonuclease
MKNCAYVLKCRNGRFYIGSTGDLAIRLSQHHAGESPATKNLRPLELAFAQEYPTRKEALAIEMWLKKLKSKTILQRIISEGKITKAPDVSS